MKQAGIDNGVEGPADLVQVEGILYQEHYSKASFFRLPPGDLDRCRCRIHPPDIVTAARQEKGVFPGPASYIQHIAGDLLRFLEAHELPLRPPDILRGVTMIGHLKKIHTAGLIACLG